MDVTRWLVFLFLVQTCRASAAATGPVAIKAKPKTRNGINVLFLMTDEQHYRSLSLDRQSVHRNAEHGPHRPGGGAVHNATCVTPYCSPSRASLINGLYPHTHDILKNVSPGAQPSTRSSKTRFPTRRPCFTSAATPRLTAASGTWATRGISTATSRGPTPRKTAGLPAVARGQTPRRAVRRPSQPGQVPWPARRDAARGRGRDFTSSTRFRTTGWPTSRSSAAA